MAVANQKGGVGKTTTAVNLGACLAELGYRVLVVDLDPQGNATTGLGINIRDLAGVDVRRDPERRCRSRTASRPTVGAEPVRAPRPASTWPAPRSSWSRRSAGSCSCKRALDEVRDDYDFVLIDCPPSLGLLTVNGLAAADEVLVPIQCEYYALEGLGQLLRNVDARADEPEPDARGQRASCSSMYDARTKLADQVVHEVREHFGAEGLPNVVPRTVRLSEAPSFGQPIIVFDPTLPGRDRVPGAGEGGERWHAAAGWVGASGR